MRQKDILTCLARGNPHGQLYPEAVRNFCIGLKNVSPAGYRFMRREFNNKIPALGTIQAWHANADLNCNPGIIKYSLKVLTRKVDEMAANGEKLIGALLFDEVAIYKLLQFVNNEMIGFESVPTIEKKNAQIASESLVFMFNAVNTELKLPVAYYFVNKLNAESKAQLVERVIQSLLECGVVLPSTTFDGFRSNAAMCQIFGADFSVFSPTFDPSFTINDDRINAMYDASHNIKLVRGCLASKGTLYDAEKREIKWVIF